MISRTITKNRLFTTVEEQTNPPAQYKGNEFASFHVKTKNIRLSINTSPPNTGRLSELQLDSNSLIRFSVFSAISAKNLEELVKNLYSSTCCLDTSPTRFFKTVFASLETDVLKIVNTSLLPAHSEDEKLGSFTVKQVDL